VGPCTGTEAPLPDHDDHRPDNHKFVHDKHEHDIDNRPSQQQLQHFRRRDRAQPQGLGGDQQYQLEQL
jgi:hypothetical protein